MSEEEQHRYELQMYTSINGKQISGIRIFLGYFNSYERFRKWCVSHGWIQNGLPHFQYRTWEDGELIKGTVGEIADEL